MKAKALSFVRWLRTAVVAGALIVALSALSFVLGCDLDNEDPKPLYGVPPDNYVQPDVDQPDLLPTPDQVSEDQLMVLYGPQPVDAAITDDLDEVPDVKAEDQPMVYYGPMPVDAVETDVVEDLPDIQAEDQPVVFYGPMPVDAGQVDDASTDVATDALDEEVKAFYGPAPLYGAQEPEK